MVEAFPPVSQYCIISASMFSGKREMFLGNVQHPHCCSIASSIQLAGGYTIASSIQLAGGYTIASSELEATL